MVSKKKLQENHEKAYAEIRKMGEQHNNRVIGIGKFEVFNDHPAGTFSLYDVGTGKQLQSHADIMKELGKIESYRIVKGGKYGDELWVR
jgi:hypothetical protein